MWTDTAISLTFAACSDCGAGAIARQYSFV